MVPFVRPCWIIALIRTIANFDQGYLLFFASSVEGQDEGIERIWDVWSYWVTVFNVVLENLPGLLFPMFIVNSACNKGRENLIMFS